ncbi:hypothetical protein PMKS-000481 [Pichia membranifaciens]|uniref:Uncharacterized protein n=1 Tax=Pichia membranifaciens TaxID=4926 RepID=A0A1Q2YBV9_9ASCO|nr:hypothetical protein PMKS-000481 [Pichia membranifaciens]
MAVSRSDSVSSFSTAGSSQFVDANSRFTDAESKMQNQPTDSQPHKDDKANVQSIADPEKEQDTDGKTEVKTKEPEQVKEPKAYVSKQEKIRQIREQNPQKGYQRDEGECHEYVFSNNMLDVLDLPNWKGLCGSLGVMCCNSCCSSGTSSVQKAAIR